MSAESAKPGTLKRRRGKIILAVLGCCAVAATICYVARPSPVQRLEPYLDRDLRTLSEDEQIKFDGLIGQLAPEASVLIRPSPPKTWNPRDWYDYLMTPPMTLLSCHSWYFWRVTNEHGEARLVLFQGWPLDTIPGGSSARIFVLDGEGRALTQTEFQTGYRITIDDASWLQDSGHGFPCVLVYSGSVINGSDIARQYYAFLDETFALVRLEHSNGKLVRNEYCWPDHTIGPGVPERTPQEWEAALRSPNRAEVLHCLVWLGGKHCDLLHRDVRQEGEPRRDAERVLATRGRSGVQSVVEALTRSEDRWVREAAQAAWDAIRADRLTR